jgi:hypothetical protein
MFLAKHLQVKQSRSALPYGALLTSTQSSNAAAWPRASQRFLESSAISYMGKLWTAKWIKILLSTA